MCTSSATSVASLDLLGEFHSAHWPRSLSSQCAARLAPANGWIGLSPRFERPTDSLSQFDATAGGLGESAIDAKLDSLEREMARLKYAEPACPFRASHDATAGGLGESAIDAKLDSLEREMARLKCAEPARVGMPAQLVRATEAPVPSPLPTISQSSQMSPLPASNGFDGQLDALERELVRMKATAACGPCAGVPLIAGGLTAGYSAQPGAGFAGFAGFGQAACDAAVQFQRAERERGEKEELLAAHMGLRGEKEELLAAHVGLIDLMQKQSESYGLLMSAHQDLIMAHKMQGAQVEDATQKSARRKQRAW